MKNKKIISIAGLPLLVLLWFGPLPARAAGPGDLLVPLGETVGIDLTFPGAVVSGYAEIRSDGETLCPAREAGIRPGDRITAVDGVNVADGRDFMAKAAGFSGASVTLTLRRDGRELTAAVTPVRNEQGTWQLGLWLRDAVRGIGTVTFYDPAQGRYGALGHGVSAPESRELLPVSGGSVTRAVVADVVPGRAGEPGELCGAAGEGILGTVESNTPQGLFGRWTAPAPSAPAVPAAADDEICPGPAELLSTVDGSGPRRFSAQILRVDRSGGRVRQLTISVTDPELLALTGGIVQGMSGSPILQNGKLVGAVTHVLVSDPSKGYGISAENMLAAAEALLPAA